MYVMHIYLFIWESRMWFKKLERGAWEGKGNFVKKGGGVKREANGKHMVIKYKRNFCEVGENLKRCVQESNGGKRMSRKKWTYENIRRVITLHSNLWKWKEFSNQQTHYYYYLHLQVKTLVSHRTPYSSNHKTIFILVSCLKII